MEGPRESLNRFLVEVFHQVLRTEDACLAASGQDLSLRELHLIEEVCRTVDQGRDNRSTAIAAAQRVTAGTLSSVAALLERKGYLERRRDAADRRVVRLFPTELGRLADRLHQRFHQELVEHVLSALDEREAEVFAQGLEQVAGFFREKRLAERQLPTNDFG